MRLDDPNRDDFYNKWARRLQDGVSLLVMFIIIAALAGGAIVMIGILRFLVQHLVR